MAKRGYSRECRRGVQALSIPRGMSAIAGAFLSHELSAEVQICLVLIVGPAAQRDIAHRMLPAFPIGLFVMVFHTARASAATTLLIDERATTAVPSPYFASDGCRDGASSAIAISRATSTATWIGTRSIAGARPAGGGS